MMRTEAEVKADVKRRLDALNPGQEGSNMMADDYNGAIAQIIRQGEKACEALRQAREAVDV